MIGRAILSFFMPSADIYAFFVGYYFLYFVGKSVFYALKFDAVTAPAVPGSVAPVSFYVQKSLAILFSSMLWFWAIPRLIGVWFGLTFFSPFLRDLYRSPALCPYSVRLLIFPFFPNFSRSVPKVRIFCNPFL